MRTDVDALPRRCAELTSAIRRRAPQAERERCIPAESIAELTEAGLFRALTPARYGGQPATLGELFEALVDIARGCASTSWVGGLFSLHAFLLTHFDRQAQDDVWSATADALIAASVAPRGTTARADGGFLIHGRWPYASGVDYAQWAILTSIVRDAASRPGRPCLFLVPASAYTVDDDWHVAGLAATGSKTIDIGRPVFVPDHRTRTVAALADDANRPPGALGAIPWKTLFTCGFAPPAIGTALAAIAAYADQIATKRAAYTAVAVRDRPAALVRLARSTADVDSARTMLRRDVDELDACASAGTLLGGDAAERVLYGVAHIVDVCAAAVDRVFRGAGGAALYGGNPLQRYFRDIHAIAQHAAVDLDAAGERYGRWLLTS